jgi:hypothetical protein
MRILTKQEQKDFDLPPVFNHADRKQVSPVARAHINILGEYDFSDDKLRDSIGIIPLKSAA